MKSFIEFILAEELSEAQSKGTYAGMRLDVASADALQKYIEANQIGNATPKEKFHTTLIYSRKECPDYTPLGRISPAYVAKPLKLETWDTRDGKRALVLKLACPQLEARHKEIMNAHNATYDFPEYIPHITLSYDVGPDFSSQKMPLPEFNLVFNNEYYEELNLSWKAST